MTWKIGQKLVHAKLGAGLFYGTVVAFGQAHWESEGWTAVPEPAPVVEAPRCEYRKGSHEGVPVLRVMFHDGVPKRMYACEACYLYSEESFGRVTRAHEFEAAGDMWTPDPAPARPPGLVPTSFGDERLGGVWASRGMK